MPAFGVARATPQFLGRDVPLGASSRGSCSARRRGWGLWAGAGGTGEGEPRASLALGLWGPGSALSSSPTPRGTGTSGDGSWRRAGHASCARPLQCPPGTDLPLAGCWGRAGLRGRAGQRGGTSPAAGTWQQGSTARLSRALNPARGAVSRQPAVS